MCVLPSKVPLTMVLSGATNGRDQDAHYGALRCWSFAFSLPSAVRPVLEKGLCRSGPPATLPLSDMEEDRPLVRHASSLAPPEILQTEP
jgi:hypothetical protein